MHSSSGGRSGQAGWLANETLVVYENLKSCNSTFKAYFQCLNTFLGLITMYQQIYG